MKCRHCGQEGHDSVTRNPEWCGLLEAEGRLRERAEKAEAALAAREWLHEVADRERAEMVDLRARLAEAEQRAEKAAAEVDHLRTDREVAWARAERAEDERDAARRERDEARARAEKAEDSLVALVEAADVVTDALRDYAPGCDVYIANAEAAIDAAREALGQKKVGGA